MAVWRLDNGDKSKKTRFEEESIKAETETVWLRE